MKCIRDEFFCFGLRLDDYIERVLGSAEIFEIEQTVSKCITGIEPECLESIGF